MKKYILAFMFISSSAFGFDFKGIELGKVSSYEKVSNTLSIQCHDEDSGKVWCIGDNTIVGYKAKVVITLNVEKVVENISIKFNPENFENIANSLTKKFGKPNIKNSIISNAMGATFNQVDMSWKDNISYMRLQKYSGSITEGSLWMVTNERMKELSSEIKKNESDI